MKKRKRRYVCKDMNNRKVYENDKFRVIDSSVIDPLNECWFYWEQGLLSFQMKVKGMNPKWASFGFVSEIGQPWCYQGDCIEKFEGVK